MVGLGAAMRARGHRAQVIVNPYFQTIVEGAGLEFVPLGTADEYRQLMGNPDLWHPQRGLRLVLGTTAGYLRQLYALVQSHYRAGETVIAAHALDFASRVFHDKCGAPLATVHFAPMAMLSLDDAPRYVGLPNVARWPRWTKKAVLWMGDRLVVDPIVGPQLNALRAEFGLAAVQRIFSRWNNSPDLVLGMFPEWFGPRQADWPPKAAAVGFPLWNPQASDELSAEVDEFLRNSEPPIVFTPGSANIHAREFFETAIDACQQIGRRGLLLTKYPEQLPNRLPEGVRHFGFVPFSLLLPRVAAIVHHGGIGTCAQGLANALPQVVMPMAYDQLDNGHRLDRLGVGTVVRRRKFKPARVSAALAWLLDSPDVAKRCRDLASRCDGSAALTAACEHLESTWPSLSEARKSRLGETALQ
jgi:UDP:flavonoid glycosyltransferase YjiC (YdhE family)